MLPAYLTESCLLKITLLVCIDNDVIQYKSTNCQSIQNNFYHFFFFFGFLIFRLAGGMGILKPSSAGSVIFTILRMKFIPLVVYFISLNFYSEMLGVKFIRMVFKYDKDFTWSKKWSDSLSRLLISTKDKEGHRLRSW